MRLCARALVVGPSAAVLLLVTALACGSPAAEGPREEPPPPALADVVSVAATGEPGAYRVWVRAHMHPDGYGGVAFRGSVRDGFAAADLPAAFAAGLAGEPPAPPDCAH